MFKVERICGVGLILCLVSSEVPSFAQANGLAKVPFMPTWTSGTCRDCDIAQWIDAIKFTGPGHAWAYGCRSSRFEHGAFLGQQPYCTVVETLDAGRTWKEIAGVESYPGHPNISFVNSNHGWISWSGGVIRTADGGRSWEKLRGEWAANVVFLDERLGVGSSRSCCSDDKAMRTTDGGREWVAAEAPHVKSIECIFFLNSESGWMAARGDREDKSVALLATDDAGAHWSRRGSMTVKQNCRYPYSTGFSVSSMAFQDLNRGWLLFTLLPGFDWEAEGRNWPESGRDCNGKRLYRTKDGGKTWTLVMNATWKKQREVAAIGFLKNGTVFAFLERSSEHLYSTDGGDHWQSFHLPAPAGQKSTPNVHDCHDVEGDLMCSASFGYYDLDDSPGMFLLRVHPPHAGQEGVFR